MINKVTERENDVTITLIPLLLLLISIVTMKVPLATLTFFFFMILFKKNNLILYIYFAFVFALIAYNWVPQSEIFDLVRHHQTFNALKLSNFSYFINRLITFESPFQILIMWLISIPFNQNALQFFVVLNGMILVFFMLYSNLDDENRIIALLIFLCSFRFLQFASGLWNYLAIILFSYSYTLKENNKAKVIIYLISFLIHFSMLIPIFVLIVTKILEKNVGIEIKIKHLIIFGVFLFISPYFLSFLLSLLSQIFSGFSLINLLNSRFNSYFINQSNHGYLQNYRYIFIELLKPVLVLIFLIYNERKSFNTFDDFMNYRVSKENLFILLLVTFLLTLGLRVRVFLRFSTLAILIFTSMNEYIPIYRNSRLFRAFLYFFFSIQFIYQVYSMFNAGMI